MNPNRRLLTSLLLALPALAMARAQAIAPRSRLDLEHLQSEVLRLEGESGGRLGVAVFDSGSGASFEHRGEERFPMCSTFKLLLAAAVLTRVDEESESLS